MGINATSVLGRVQRFYARPESAVGTFAVPRAADAMRIQKASIKLDYERMPRADARQTASLQEQITGLRKVTWNATKYFMPHGTAGTAPDDGDVLTALFGVATVNGGSNVVYSFSSSQTIPTLSITHENASTYAAAASGCVANQGKWTLKSAQPAMVEYSGMGMEYIHTGTSTSNGSILDAATTVHPATADVDNFSNNSYIQVGTSTGHLVTAGGGTTSLTVSPGISGAQSDGAVIAPYVPSETVSGSPVSGTLNTFTIDTVALTALEAEIEVDNGFKPNDQQTGITYVTDFIRGFRSVKGSISVRATKSEILNLGKHNLAVSTTRALVLTGGTGAGKRFSFSIPYAELTLPEIDIPEADEAVIKLSFVALASSAGDDEMTLTVGTVS